MSPATSFLLKISRPCWPNTEVIFCPLCACLRAATPVIHLRPRGCGADWQLTCPATSPSGEATLTYRFHGPAQFASNQASADIPLGASLTVTVASGLYKGTQL